MPPAYYKAGETASCTIKVARGDASPESVNIEAVFWRGGEQVETLARGLALSEAGDEVSFDWDTTGALEQGELAVPVALEARGSKLWGRLPAFVYQPRIEVWAVDDRDEPVAGALCEVTIQVDRDFRRYGRRYRKAWRSRRGGVRIYRAATDANGRAVFRSMPMGTVTVEWVKPHMLTAVGWKEEGDFTRTGPKRKAEIEKTPVVHYVWWGDPQTAEHRANATQTPNAMAAQRATVRYWRQAGAFSGVLDPNIEDRPIARLSDLLRGGDGRPMHSGLMGRGIMLDNIVATLAHYRAFSAVKDLVSLCVLYREGGYYFDTTTALLAAPASIPGRLVPHDRPRLARTKPAPGYKGYFYFFLHDRGIEATLAAQMVPEEVPGVVKSVGYDVWAMYAPPRHPAVLQMLLSYIARCEHFGLYEAPSTKRQFGGKTIHAYMTQDDKEERNRIIGNLIITSVQEGLVAYAQAHGLPLDAYGWTTTEPDAAAVAAHHVSAECADLGIGKRHAGQWRQG